VLDDSELSTRLIRLGVALLAFGLGCHFWSDRVFRTGGLLIGLAQVCRYLLATRFPQFEERDPQVRFLVSFDHFTAILLVMVLVHGAFSAQL
jgi:hypothetical protein